MAQQRVHFPGLDGVRAIAVLMVFVGHVEYVKSVYGAPSLVGNPVIALLPGLGVTLFFVLSGFLITSLLLREKATFGRIDIRAFYMRRILRIWPLYFVCVFLGFGILPAFGFATLAPQWPQMLALYLVMLPNVAYAIFPNVIGAAQLWSVGVEEQFYAFWPFLVRAKRLLPWLIVIVVVMFAINAAARHLAPEWVSFFRALQFQAMAIGAIAALAVFHSSPVLRLLVGWPGLLSCLAVLLWTIVLYGGGSIGAIEIQATCLAVFLLNATAKTVRLDWSPLVYLGKISYSFYLWHGLILYTLGAVLPQGIAYSLWMYAWGLALSVLVSALTYHLIERPFLRKKVSFSRIVSGREEDAQRGHASLSSRASESARSASSATPR
jgi:peptidoglycan/LPS O-acetylase OafA/YrhL